MKKGYVVSCESVVDLPVSTLQELCIPTLSSSNTTERKQFTDSIEPDSNAPEKFKQYNCAGEWLDSDQLSLVQYLDFFKSMIDDNDVIHVAPSSALSSSCNTARLAADLIMKAYPECRISVIDSLCVSIGYGMLVCGAAEQRNSGYVFEQTEQWILENRLTIQHVLFTDNLKYLQRGGFLGRYPVKSHIFEPFTLFSIDKDGKLAAFSRAHREKDAIEQTIFYMSQYFSMDQSGPSKCWVYHSEAPEYAQKLKDAIELCFPQLRGQVQIFAIGPAVASCCGPNTVAASFFGDRYMKNSMAD